MKKSKKYVPEFRFAEFSLALSVILTSTSLSQTLDDVGDGISFGLNSSAASITQTNLTPNTTPPSSIYLNTIDVKSPNGFAAKWDWKVGFSGERSYNRMQAASYYSRWDMIHPLSQQSGVSADITGFDPNIKTNFIMRDVNLPADDPNSISVSLSSHSINYFKNQVSIGTLNPDPNAALDVKGNILAQGSVTADNLVDGIPSFKELDDYIAIAMQQGEAKTVVLTDIITITRSFTIPSNITVKFISGKSGFHIDDDQVLLKIKGIVDAGPWGIFSGKIKNAKVISGQPIYTEWYGAIGGDGLDDQPAIQAAIESSGESGPGIITGTTVQLLGKIYHLSAPLSLVGVNDRRLVGIGTRKTYIKALTLDQGGQWNQPEYLKASPDYSGGVSAMVFMGSDINSGNKAGAFGSGLENLGLDASSISGLSGIYVNGSLEEQTHIKNCLIIYFTRYGIGTPSTYEIPNPNYDPNHGPDSPENTQNETKIVGQDLNMFTISNCVILPSLEEYSQSGSNSAPIAVSLRGETFTLENCSITTVARSNGLRIRLPYLVRVTAGAYGVIRDLHMENATTGIWCAQQGLAPNLNLNISNIDLFNEFKIEGETSQVIKISANSSSDYRAVIVVSSIGARGHSTYTILDEERGVSTSGAGVDYRRFTGQYVRSFLNEGFRVLSEDPALLEPQP